MGYLRFFGLRLRPRLLLGILAIAGLAVIPVAVRAQGFDTGRNAPDLVARLGPKELAGTSKGLWLRIRGVPDPASARPGEVGAHRAALVQLRARGLRVCVLLFPPAASWAKGVRAQPLARLPLDLREAYAWMSRLQFAYGDLVDAWEIDNEPDIQFVVENPETYAAYLKACWWGAAAGRTGREAGGGRRDEMGTGGQQGPRTIDQRTTDQGTKGLTGGGGPAVSDQKGDVERPEISQLSALNSRPSAGCDACPLVLMGALALPPGPYLERFVANDGLGYTDGFNYHYYGYAQDFSGVYRQFERAVKELTAKKADLRPEGGKLKTEAGGRTTAGPDAETSPADQALEKRTLPVFLTECGYSMLSGEAGLEKEGRLRQWDWFRDVGTQARKLRIEGAMAFLLMPYLEYGAKEYGLTMRREARGQRPESGEMKPESGDPRAESGEWAAGGLEFRVKDFGTRRAENWMRGIGRAVAGDEASPALAWLLEDARTKRRPSRGWKVETTEPSPVVIDFVADPKTLAAKRCQGYFLDGGGPLIPSDGEGKRESGLRSIGGGELRIYNFGARTVAGTLDLGGFASCAERGSVELTLAPGEMRVIRVALTLVADRFRGSDWRVIFRGGEPRCSSVFSTLLYPSTRGMMQRVLRELRPGEAGPRNRLVLARRSLAKGEPVEETAGPWRVTPGVTVSEREGVWSFAVERLPDAPTRPAFAELALPDDFQLPPDSLLRLEYRCVPPVAGIGAGRTPTVADRSALQRDAIGIYWRSAGGEFFTVWRPPPATPTWQRYTQMRESYTMGFYGRAGKPWRFAESRPAALVFTFMPGALPTIFQFRAAEVFEYIRKNPEEKPLIHAKERQRP